MSNNLKKLITLEIAALFFIMIISLVSSLAIIKTYENKLISSNSYILNTIIKKYPELEDEIIESITTGDIKDFDKTILERRNIDKLIFNYNNDYKKFKQNIINTNLIALFISVTILLLIFTYYYYIERKKLKDLSVYLREILNGNYNMDIRNYDEGLINNLKNEIYKVTVKLREQADISLKDKKNLEIILSDISHQLKTPLTGMYVINDILGSNITKEERKEFLRKNYLQLQRIEWLVTSLLKIARLDSGSIKLESKKVKVSEIIDKALVPLLIPIELKEIELIINCDNNIYINADLNWTSEALLNIIKNASEHVSKSGRIEIIVNENPIYVEVLIKDNGEGIKSEDMKHIFERFYKASSSKESIGIGLNMTKKIIDLEQGDISVSSIKNKGTTFSVKFYKNII